MFKQDFFCVSITSGECAVQTKTIKVTQNSIGKNTRSKTRAMTETKNDTDSSSTSVHSHGKRKRQAETPKKIRKSTKMQIQEHIDNNTPNKQYLADEIILATVPGYAPWPARILTMIGQTISVQFFGTGQMYANSFNLLYENSFLMKYFFFFQKFGACKFNIAF